LELGVKNLGSGTKVVKVKLESKWNVSKSGLITKKKQFKCKTFFLSPEYTTRKKYFSRREPKWECRQCFEGLNGGMV